jgi:hypothetical protein
MFSHCLLPNGLSELFVQVVNTRKITLADRYGLMALLCKESTSDEELQVVNRILYALRQDRIQVIDDLSTLKQAFF